MIDKRALRSGMRALRMGLAKDGADAAARAADHVHGLPQATCVAVYHPIGSELGTAPLVEALIARGVDLCLPVTLAPNAPMIFRRWTPGDPLEADLAGVPAPFPLAGTVVPDLIFAPLLAFDGQGLRLGQGGGHYDRTFAALPDAIRIGLAYAGQQVEALPFEPHDIPLHGVLTETGYTAFA
ncbi:MAG: 5-formyltetrahydrofolate cyclo-ligase [Brevundimonas sp.]|uniref:5-formyltetrahydrofolate cyclo-ligase n=1 Tax=Brevundimonas sp. TaxID=1871086 RepID=UPI002ABC01DA|nr:5-formyltetrahydrofolate cyclo-ligase [Brevundimonas sp.]MDZ4113523.1 5-formyltetrahydrofolate cyclo-ligase [Brevundimonas sp.]